MKLDTLVLTEAEEHNKAMEYVISAVMDMSVRSHFWHWQTKSYAAHEAFGKFYENITEHMDSLAEQFMGAGGEFNVGIDVRMNAFSVEGAVEDLNKFKEKLVDLETVLMKDENGQFHGVADTLIDIIKEVDMLQYRLTLK